MEWHVGQTVAYLRLNRARLTQPALASALKSEWTKRLGHEDQLYGAEEPNSTSIRSAISEIENNKRQLRFPYTELLQEVLKIPDDFFRIPPKSKIELERRLEKLDSEIRLNPLADPSVATKVPAAIKKTFLPQGLPRHNRDAVFRQRERLVETLNGHIINRHGPRIILLSGPSGIGKSTLIQKWFELFGSKDKVSGFYIQCSNKKGEDIINEIYQNLLKFEIRASSVEQIVEAFTKYELLIVLDGMGQNSNVDSDLSDSQRTRVLPLLSELSDISCSSKILIARSTDLPTFSNDVGSSLVQALVGRYVNLALGGLPPADGEEYLEKLKIFASKTMLEKISTALGGSPTDLLAWANSIPERERANAHFIERRSIGLRSGKDRGKADITSETFQIFLDGLSKERPYEALLLLVTSAVREDISIISCDRILKGLCDTERMSSSGASGILSEEFTPKGVPQKTDSLLRSDIQNLFHFSGGRVRLHPRPRHVISGLLARYLNQAEQTIVHVLAARFLRYAIPTPVEAASKEQKYKPDEIHVKALHDLLFHLNALYMLYRVEEKSTKFRSGTLRIEHVILHDVSLRHAPRPWLSADDIINYAYGSVMLPGIGGENHVITRQLGDYEQKLSMLSLFLENDIENDSDLVVPKPELSPQNRRQVVADLAICALRSGRLALADRAYDQITKSRNFEKEVDWRVLIDSLRPDKSDEVRHFSNDLNRYTELLNTRATVYARRGQLEEARDLLRRDARVVQSVLPELKLAFDRRNPNRLTGSNKSNLSAGLIAARRVLAKYGQIAALIGNPQSLTYFDVAKTIEGLRTIEGIRATNAILRGETGRTYCKAILRKTPPDTASAAASIRDNLSFCNEQNRYYEVLEWTIEQLVFARITSDEELWKAALYEAEKLVSSKKMSLSFSAYWELELEKIRGKIRFGILNNNAVNFLKSGLVNLGISGHLLLRCDSWLLLAELDRENRAEHVANAREFISQNSYGFRGPDIALLESGKTALDLA